MGDYLILFHEQHALTQKNQSTEKAGNIEQVPLAKHDANELEEVGLGERGEDECTSKHAQQTLQRPL